jgi:hypothetical protein
MSDLKLDPYIGATDEEVAEIEALASSHTVLHWAALLRLIHRMRNAEASADYAWQRADVYDKRAQSFEPDLMKALDDNKRLRGTLEYILAQAKQGYPTVLSVIKANAKAALDDEWQKTYAEARAALAKEGK